MIGDIVQIIANNMWLRPNSEHIIANAPTQATERVRQIIKDAERKNHPASLGLALSWAPGVFIWVDDIQAAEEHVDWLRTHAETHSLRPYLAVARGYEGTLAIARGNARAGVEDIHSCLEQLHSCPCSSTPAIEE